MKNDKQDEFVWAKELEMLKRENMEIEHKLKMERLAFERESQRKFHEMQMERERIKSAEIRKAQMRRESGNTYH